MVNCNPETVSTDYDTSDGLYFEPLIDEYVLILLKEKSKGTFKWSHHSVWRANSIKLAKFLYENNSNFRNSIFFYRPCRR